MEKVILKIRILSNQHFKIRTGQNRSKINFKIQANLFFCSKDNCIFSKNEKEKKSINGNLFNNKISKSLKVPNIENSDFQIQN